MKDVKYFEVVDRYVDDNGECVIDRKNFDTKENAVGYQNSSAKGKSIYHNEKVVRIFESVDEAIGQDNDEIIQNAMKKLTDKEKRALGLS